LTKKLGELAGGLKKGLAGASWVRPENIHLTLKFLGELSPARAEEVAEVLKGAAEGLESFTLTASGVKGFPNLTRPRVLWVGIEESEALLSLYEEIEQTLSYIGIEKETRPFKAHLTLCRVRSAHESGAIGASARGPGSDINVEFSVDSFELFKSVLKPGGAVHSTINSIPLKKD
jgi:2'-5' RNA ligase